jgi:hypothetical protein
MLKEVLEQEAATAEATMTIQAPSILIPTTSHIFINNSSIRDRAESKSIRRRFSTSRCTLLPRFQQEHQAVLE